MNDNQCMRMMLDAATSFTNARNTVERLKEEVGHRHLMSSAMQAMEDEQEKFYMALDIYVKRRVDRILRERHILP